MSEELPRLPKRFFQWYCKPSLQESILGDLEEQFEEDVEVFGKLKANRRFAWNIIRFFRPGITGKLEGTQKLNHFCMFKNNLKFGWRNLTKQKGFFALNIFGLAIGIAACLVISLFIIDELSYDRFNEKADRIARVVLKGEVQGESINEAISPAAVAPTFQEEFPEVQAGTRLKSTEIPLISIGDKHFRESRFAYVDPNFFHVFSTRFLKGDAKTALAEPNTILITESEAEKYFGSDDPMGRVLAFTEWGTKFKITGVIENIPANAHFHFDLFGSMESYRAVENYDWLNSDFHSYILLKKGAGLADIQKKIPSVVTKNMGPQLQKAFGISMTQFEESGNRIGLYLQPLLDIHLYSNFSSQSELEAGGNIDSLYIFGLIALFALVVSCINFINLSTAAASRRMKEVGLKKVLGSGKSQLVIQFMTESFLTTIAAMFLSTLIIGSGLHFFNDISGKQFVFSDFIKPDILLGYFVFGLIIIHDAGVLGQDGQKVFKEKLLTNSLVEQVSISNHLPAGPTNSSMDNVFLSKGSSDFRRSPVYYVDEAYIPTMGIELLSGRNFSDDFGTEKNLIIVNETFARTYGLGKSPVGKTIETTVDQSGNKVKSTIIGLIKDFHFQPLHKKIEPLIIRKNASSGVIVRSKIGNIPSLLVDMNELWGDFNVAEPFTYALLDDLYNRTYLEEQNVGKLFKVFAGLTILIATLGLFGLVTFTIARRTKEIGIRKVLGSSTGSIILLLSLKFFKLIGLALLIALPVGFFSMNFWLEDFAYRIEIKWWVFAIAGSVTLLVSWVTVTTKSWIAATVNPVESLRDE